MHFARCTPNVGIICGGLNQRVFHVLPKDTFDLHISFGKFENIKAHINHNCKALFSMT